MYQLKKDNTKRAQGPFFLALSEIRSHLLNPHLEDKDFVRLIKEMSEKFTTKREKIKDYVLDDDRVASYTAIYLPTNIPKLNFLISKLSDEMLEDIFKRPFIDVGCGPGTYGLGICLESSGTIPEVHFIDSSPVMLRQAEKLMKAFFPNMKARYDQRVLAESSKSVLFFGHSINELGVSEAMKMVARVSPEYVMWIEPGTSALFPELLELRERLVSDYDILYPCPTADACPSNWCHQVLRTSHAQDVERLTQLVGLDRKTLPMVGHVYKRKQPNKLSNKSVVTRYMTETKFSFEYEVCHVAENENKLSIIEIQKKSLTKSEVKLMKEGNVGETIEYEVIKELENKVRVKLK